MRAVVVAEVGAAGEQFHGSLEALGGIRILF